MAMESLPAATLDLTRAVMDVCMIVDRVSFEEGNGEPPPAEYQREKLNAAATAWAAFHEAATGELECLPE